MKLSANILAAAILALAATVAQADGIVYVGVGPDDETAGLTGNSQPFSVGFLGVSGTGGPVIGVDIAGEGVMLDSTWGGNELQQAMSLNLLAGGNISHAGSTRIDAAAIIGMRQTFADCPDSYIGYQCYADQPPEVDFAMNYGVFLGVTFSNLTVGVRATGESTQFITGFKF